MNVLFVCLGNICRSPSAEIVCHDMAVSKGMPVQVDSAGTAAFHAGEPPDARSIAAAALRGYDMSHLRARKVMLDDFYRFDVIFAMDSENLMNLRAMQPKNSTAKLCLFLKKYGSLSEHNVPDPYYGGGQGFERVLDLLEDATEHFLKAQVKK